MAIDMERTLMQGKLAELKEEKAKLRLKAEGLCNGIKTLVNPALNDVEEMDIALADNQMSEMVTVHIDLLEVTAKIQRLEKALNG